MFTKSELAVFKKLNTPAKIQDFLNTIPFNFEKNGKGTLKSPVRSFRENNAHCFEGALLGAYILSLHGHKPLVMTLVADRPDVDHCIAPFQINGLWGALSKTNHAVLRYREPVYKNVRELVMSYFHEYFLDDGTKTLRNYSKPLDLDNFEDVWIFADFDLWSLDDELDRMQHYDIVPNNLQKHLRRADLVERAAGKLIEWDK